MVSFKHSKFYCLKNLFNINKDNISTTVSEITSTCNHQQRHNDTKKNGEEKM